MYIKKYMFIVAILIWSNSLFSTEQSVSIHIADDALQNTIDMLINAKALGYGSYNGSGELNYLMNATDAEIEFSEGEVKFSIDITAKASVSYWPIGFSASGSFTLTLSSDVACVYENGKYNLILDNIALDDFDIDDFPDFIEDAFETWFNIYTALVLDEVTLATIPNPFPEVNTELFTTSAPQIEIADGEIVIYLTTKTATILANKDVNTSYQYLGGTLSLYDNSNSSWNKLNMSSPSTVSVNAGDTYHAKTHAIELSGLYHQTWTNEVSHTLTTTNYTMSDDYIEKNIIAYFDEKNSVTLSVNPSSVTNEVVQYHDPWYYDESTQTQPDCYRTIAPGSYSVFLNQNTGFNPAYPVYSLKAPHYAATTDGIYAFSGWTASPSASAGFESASSCETAVVFKSAGVTVTANYGTKVSNQANYTATIPADETLTIPASRSGPVCIWLN